MPISPIAMSGDQVEPRVDATRRFWAGHGRLTVSVTPVELRAGLQKADHAARVAAHVEHLPRLAELPGTEPPAVYPDFGTISQAEYWGCRDTSPVDIELPFAEPVAMSLDEALAIEPASPDAAGFAADRALRLRRDVSDQLGMEAKDLWLRTPDAQGVLNTGGMIVEQSELLMGMVAESDKAHALLDRVGDWLLGYWRHLRAASGDRVGGNVWPHAFLPGDLGIALTEDLMPMLAPETFVEFGVPQLRKIERAFGGLLVHCCGQWGRHAQTYTSERLNLLAAEFHYPYTTLDELAALPEQTVLIPYIALDKQNDFADVASYYHHLLDAAPAKRRFWFALIGDDAETLALADSLSKRA